LKKVIDMTQIVTGNDLVSGRVVYLKSDGGWSERIGESRIGDTEEDGQVLLANAQMAAARQDIVDPYLIDVERVGAGIRPLRYRESIRANGPTIWKDPGAQPSKRN
jgi:uncharacterized protein DUF2849